MEQITDWSQGVLAENQLSLYSGDKLGMNILGSVIGLVIITWILSFSFILLYKSEIKQHKFLKLLKMMNKIGKNKRRKINTSVEKTK